MAAAISLSGGKVSHHNVVAPGQNCEILAHSWILWGLEGGRSFIFRSGTKLVNPLSYTHKANGIWQQLSACLWKRFHNIMWLHYVKIMRYLLNHGYSEAWKGCILAFRSGTKLVNPLSYTHKANGTWQQLSACLEERFHITMLLHQAKIVRFWHIHGYSEA